MSDLTPADLTFEAVSELKPRDVAAMLLSCISGPTDLEIVVDEARLEVLFGKITEHLEWRGHITELTQILKSIHSWVNELEKKTRAAGGAEPSENDDLLVLFRALIANVLAPRGEALRLSMESRRPSPSAT